MALKRIQSREHRERSQPAARQKLGLLEKKKDYVLRARDFHKKEKRLKALKLKASLKNPDEFYFGMINAKTDKGIHSVSSKPELPQDVLKLMKTQDLHYVSMLKRMNEKKLERLSADLPQSLQNQEATSEHIVFVENDEEREALLADVQQDELSDGEDASEASDDDMPVKKQNGSAALHEYQVRKQRIDTLALAERKLITQRHIMQPGRRKIVGQDEYEQPIFKWKAQRKKYNGELKLGQVVDRRPGFVPVTMADENEMIEVRFLSNGKYTSQSTRLVKSPFIRFHRAPDHPIPFDSLSSFQQAAFQCLRDSFAQLEAAIERRAKFSGKAAIIYEADLAHEVFGRHPTLEQLYAVHIYLYGNVDKIVKDVGYRSTPAYHIRSERESKLLEGVRALPASVLEEMATRLYDALFNNHTFIRRTETDKLLVDVLITFASTTYINASGPVSNPFLPAVTKMVSGICQPVPSEIHRILIQLHLFPLDFDPAEHNSGTLQHEHKDQVHSYRLVSPEKWDYSNEIADTVFAIDSQETVEVDDAVQFGSDGWVHVHIADSAHFVQYDSFLEKIARNRVSTVYLPSKTFPMLPSDVTELMSLSPGRAENPALTFSAKIGTDGDITDYRIIPSVLKNVKRLNYEGADTLITKNPNLQAGLALLEAHRSRRISRGHLPFTIPKPSVKVVEGQTKFSIQGLAESPSQRLVSEAMMIAGRVAAMQAAERKLAIPFRYHLPPKQPSDHGVYDRIRSGTATRFDTLQLLMSLGPSAVDTQPREHWAMGLDMYTKATSPIRRYFDMLVHHQLRAATDKPVVLSENSMAALIPSVYRHEQYLKQVQKISTRFWAMKHYQSLLASDPDDPLLTTRIIILDSASGARQKVWVENLALILYATVLGRVPNAAAMSAGHEIEAAKIISVDPMRSSIDLTIL